MISINEANEWLKDFEFETGKEHDPRTVKTDNRIGWPQLKFCLWDNPNECYIMMRDANEAKLLARDIILNDCIDGYDQDCPKEEYEQDLYAIERAEYDWCREVSGEDAGCEEISGGEVYWQQL